MNVEDDASAQSIIVIGSKPCAAFPMVKASVVLTANSAVERGLAYRKKYNSRIIAFVHGVGVQAGALRQSLVKSRPDEIVVMPAVLDSDNLVSIIKNDLGLTETIVSVISIRERNRLMADILGWRKILVMAHVSKSRGIKHIRYALPDLLGPRKMMWLVHSTGLSAILYGMRRFPNAREIIATGIGLEGGVNFDGVGEFKEKIAKADRMTIKHWPHKKRLSLFTTDDSMSRIGNVPKWKGELSYFEDTNLNKQ